MKIRFLPTGPFIFTRRCKILSARIPGLVIALCLVYPAGAQTQPRNPITEAEVGQWLAEKYDCPADPPPHFWRFDLFDFKGDGSQEAVVVASTCETGTAGPDVHSVLARDPDERFVEWKISEPDPHAFENMFGNRNFDLAVQDGTLVATFEDDPDREVPPLIITYKRNAETFEVSSIQKTGVFPTSYDCAKATSEVERAICHVPVLAALDLRLGESYKTLAARLPRPERDKLKSEQREWVRRRNRECEPYKGWIGCISGMYQKRLQELEKPASTL